jgi:hypothetical protein
MAGFIAGALSSLLKENKAAIEASRALARAVSGRPTRLSKTSDVSPALNGIESSPSYTWTVHFKTADDLLRYDRALRALVDAADLEEGG